MRTVDRAQAGKYLRVARALRSAAEDLTELTDDDTPYANATAIVAIHSAIAYTDALSIAYGGFKSAEGEHELAVEALSEALGRRADSSRLKTLRGILRRKDAVSYQGAYFPFRGASVMVEKLNDFAEWAEQLYDQRP